MTLFSDPTAIFLAFGRMETELPELLGPENWQVIKEKLEQLKEQWANCTEPGERRLLAAELVQLLAPYGAAREKLRQEIMVDHAGKRETVTREVSRIAVDNQDAKSAIKSLEKPRPEFFFKLKGENVYGNSVEVDTEVCLEFYLGEADQETIAKLKAIKLDKALASGGELNVFIVPVGYRLIERDCSKKAMICDWAMQGEIVFKLQAGPVQNPDAGTWVYLDLNRTPLYAFFLVIPTIAEASQVQPATGELQAIDLDAKGIPSAARLVITQDKGNLIVYYHNMQTHFCVQKSLSDLTLAKLNQILNGVPQVKGGEVARNPVWNGIPDPFEPSLDDDQKQLLTEQTSKIAQAGWDLWVNLTADPILKTILDDLKKLPSRSRFEVITDSVFVPWEIVYPENPDLFTPADEGTNGSVKPMLFWGAKYIIQSTLSDVYDLAQEKKEHYANTSNTRICINPSIDDDFFKVKTKPAASHRTWAKESLAEPPEARGILLHEREVAKWLYFFCHGQSGVVDKLELDQQNELLATQLRGTAEFKGRPIVFLNSCQSAAFAPLSLTNFYKEFREAKKVLGLIGTSFPVPAITAGAIGQRITQEYLDGKKDLGTILFELRKDLVKNLIPIGLFYTLHCPADIRPKPVAATA